MIFHQLEMRVLDQAGRDLGPDEVTLRLTSVRGTDRPRYHQGLEVFFFRHLRPGDYRLKVEGPAGRLYDKPLQVDPADTKIAIRVGVPESPAEAEIVPPIAVVVDLSAADRDEVLHDLDRLASEVDLERREDRIPGRLADELVVFSSTALEGRSGEPERGKLTQEALRTLRQSSAVRTAGIYRPVTGSSGYLLTGELYLRFELRTSRQRMRQVLEDYGLANATPLASENRLFRVTASEGASHRIDALAQELRQESGVADAQPIPIVGASLDSPAHGRFFSPRWDRDLIAAMAARQLVAAEESVPLVAVFDKMLVPEDDLRRHPHFADSGSAFASRVEKVYDFRFSCVEDGLAAVNPALVSVPAGAHGLICAGLIASGPDGMSPRSRILLLGDPEHDVCHVDAYRWAAGLAPPPAGAADLPELAGQGAAVFSTSMGRDDRRLSANAELMMRDLTRRGRQGKGCLLFFSAGNDGTDILLDRPYGASPFALSVAASTRRGPGGAESFAEYSGFGDVELCAPSGTRIEQHDEQIWHGDLYDRVGGTWLPHRGTYPSEPLVVTKTLKAANAGETAIDVAHRSRLVPSNALAILTPTGRWIENKYVGPDSGASHRIHLKEDLPFAAPKDSLVVAGARQVGILRAHEGRTLELEDVAADLRAGHEIMVAMPGLGAGSARSYTVASVEGATLTVEEELDADHGAGDYVFRDATHLGLLAGTSSSTPLCAGVAALMLQANPKLTWVEVRHLLRETAEKIDPRCDDPRGVWRDRSGNESPDDAHYSRRYGFGRVNAVKAVTEALGYQFPRDLMIRRAPQDDGLRELARLEDSPDIWVRSTDPLRMDERELADATLHESPHRDTDHWIFARITNRGEETSLAAWVRFHVAAGKEAAYTFPRDFDEPPHDVLGAGPWPRGMYFIGEVAISGVAAKESKVVHVFWPRDQLPPPEDPAGQPWDPRILIEITPFDGPLEGFTIRDNNNLAQRSIDILLAP